MVLSTNSHTHQRGRLLSSSRMPSTSWSSSNGSLSSVILTGSFRGSVVAGGKGSAGASPYLVVFQRERAHFVKETFLLAPRPNQRASKNNSEEANGDRAECTDAANGFDKFLDHKIC